MERITFDKLWSIMNEFNTRFPDKSEQACLKGVIVYKASNWEEMYSTTERSYEVANNSRAFQNNKISNRLSGDCLDGKDLGVRLDWYNWDIDYCYMV
mgnify:CR=1 FL=1